MKPAEILEAAFRDARSRGRLAIIPFLTAGDPDASATVELAVALGAAGATALELGIPFSDPIADGPVIQEASQRALAGGMNVSGVLEVACAIRSRTTLPLIAMTYANPILRYGAEKFALDAARAGFNATIVTDLPPEELPTLWDPLRAAGLATILLVTPLTRQDRMERILTDASGFVYVVSRTGVTGQGQAAQGLDALLASLRERTKLPVVVGFGIESPAHVAGYKGRADGVVVGTALVRRIAAAPAGRAPEIAAEFLGSLILEA